MSGGGSPADRSSKPSPAAVRTDVDAVGASPWRGSLQQSQDCPRQARTRIELTPRTTSMAGAKSFEPARPWPLVYNPVERICRLRYLAPVGPRPFLRYNVTAPGFIGVSGIFRSVTRLVCNVFKKLDFSSFF